MSRSQSSESKQARGARTRRVKAGEEAPPPRLPRLPGQRGAGRAGANAKEQLTEAFTRLGDVAALVTWGRKNPTEFYRIWARLIPKEENVSVTQLGVEDLLRQLDEQGPASGDASPLSVMDEAGASLGLPRPEPLGTVDATHD